jgi:hypothetical protein
LYRSWSQGFRQAGNAGESAPISVARIICHDDGLVLHQTDENGLTDKSDTVYSTCSIVREKLAMNDAMIAAETQGEERTEAHDFVEMGSVSEETRGGVLGVDYDGVPGGRWN